MIDVLFPTRLDSNGLRVRYSAAWMRGWLRMHVPHSGNKSRWEIIVRNDDPEDYQTAYNNSWYIRFHNDADATFFLLKWSGDDNEKV